MPARVRIDGRVARHAVVEGPAQRIDAAPARADSDRPGGRARRWPRRAARRPPGRIEVRQRRDGRRQEHLVLDGSGAWLGAPIGAGSRGSRGCAAPRPWSDGSTLERRDACDVEELRPDGVLDLALVALVGQDAHRADGQERHGGEERSQADAEPLPGPERPCRAGRRAVPARVRRAIRHPLPGRLAHLHALRCSEGAPRSTDPASVRFRQPILPYDTGLGRGFERGGWPDAVS